MQLIFNKNYFLYNKLVKYLDKLVEKGFKKYPLFHYLKLLRLLFELLVTMNNCMMESLL